MDKRRKINKDFVLSDSSINVYGYRLLTSGYMIEEFQKNPIGYYMHERDMGVLVIWEDVRIEGDKVMGKPVINLNHPKGQQVADDMDNGFLNGASVGSIQLEDYHMDGEVLVGTKWWNKECSIVDIPGNRSSLAVDLFDANEQKIDLNDLKLSLKNSGMKKVQLSITPALVAMLGLADGGNNADENIIAQKIQDLHDKAQKADQFALANKALTTQKETAEKQLKYLQDATVTAKVKDLLDKALGEKRLTKDLSDKFAVDYATEPDKLAAVLDAMKPYKPLTQNLGDDGNSAIPEKYKGKNWDELFEAEGALQDLKDNHVDLFKQVYREKYNKEYIS